MTRKVPPPAPPGEALMRTVRGQGPPAEYAVLFNMVEALYHYMQTLPWPDNRVGLDDPRPPAPARRPSDPVSQFMEDWTSGNLQLPFQACTGLQLCRAFHLRWLELGLTRGAPSQPVFTTRATRWLRELQLPAVQYKMVKARLKGLRDRQTLRYWVPLAGSDVGRSVGERVGEEVEAFEDALEAYALALGSRK